MLGKLLKYEIPALGRKLLPLYIGWMATAILLGISVANVESKSEFFMVISMLMYIAVAVAVYVMAIVLIIQRFNNDLLGDGGYFNHSLPVTASQHIGNKLIGAIIWVFLSLVALFLTILIIGTIGSGDAFFMALFSDDFKYILSQLGANEWLLALEMLIAMLVSSAKSILAIYTAITLGHQARDKVILASIGIYIGLLVAESMFLRIISPIVPGINELLIVGEIESTASMHSILIPSILITIVIGAAYFFICRHYMSKKLNLA